jgi:hypothetical protein
MTTDVTISPDILVIVPNDNNGRFADINGRNITRLRDISRDANQYPVLVKKDLNVRFKDVLATEKLTGHAVPRLTAPD